MQKSSVILKTTALFEHLYFHDSTLKYLRFNRQDKLLEMKMDFCLWMQDFYNEQWPEVIEVAVRFFDIANFVIDSPTYDVSDGDILSFEITDNTQAKMILYKNDVISILLFESRNCKLKTANYVLQEMLRF